MPATLGPHFLFYATAGGAVGDFRLADPTGATHNPTAPLGWTAGAGIEYLFNDAISAKVEYLYVNLGTVSCPAGTLCSIDNMRDYQLRTARCHSPKT